MACCVVRTASLVTTAAVHIETGRKLLKEGIDKVVKNQKMNEDFKYWVGKSGKVANQTEKIVTDAVDEIVDLTKKGYEKIFGSRLDPHEETSELEGNKTSINSTSVPNEIEFNSTTSLIG